jgi:hypothetical protein
LRHLDRNLGRIHLELAAGTTLLTISSKGEVIGRDWLEP